MTMSDFDEILSLLPNVVHLVVGPLTLRTKNQPIAKKLKRNHQKMSTKEYPKLRHCILELPGMYFDAEFLATLNRQLPGIFTELRSGSMTDENWSVLIKRQTNIKKIIMTYFDVDDKNIAIFDNFKLDSLELCSYGKNMQTMLSKQTQLKSLKMLKIDGDVMNVILNQLTELETCSLCFPHDNVAPFFMNFGKLKKLKHLTLRYLRTELLAYLPKLDDSRITSLDIDCLGAFSNDIIRAIAKFAPNLKVFRLECCYDFNYHALGAILRNLNFVEVIQITDSKSRNFYNTTPLMQGECFNQNLLELNIDYGFSYDRAFLNKLIADYPKLKKLTIKSTTPLNSKQFQLLLNGFQKMESMTLIRGASKLTAEDVQCLKHNKKNFKFISFRDLNRAVRDEIKKWDLLGVINVDC